MTTLLQDIRYALRMLGKAPGFTAVAVLTLALGIGANTAIFSVLDSVLLRSLPVSHPEELSLLTDPDSHGQSFGSEGGERSLLAYSEFQYLHDHNEAFSKLFAADSQLPDVDITIGNPAASGGTQRETARVRLVSGEYFETLALQPAAGRFFTPEVDRVRRGAPIAVISYAFWKSRFALDPSALGKSIQIRNNSFEIVGVTTPSFFGETVGEAPDLWIPITMQDVIYPGRDLLSPSPQGLLNQHIWLQAMGRRKPGISNAQANASINVDFQHLVESLLGSAITAEERKESLEWRIKVQSASRGASTLHEAFGEPLKFLMVLVGLVLLIACANVANLLLARGAARQREFTMRLAIGADRSRLVRQLLTESMLLAVIGAGIGILFAFWADSLLLRMVGGVANGPASVQLELQPDARVLAFTLLVTALTAVLFGFFPALHATRLDLSSRMKSSGSRGAVESGKRGLSLNKSLVVAQVSFSVVLLIAAGLFVRSLAKLSRVNLGYNRENLLLFRVNAAAGGYKGPSQTRLYEDLLGRISAIPGLRGVAVSHNGLFSGSESGDPVAVEGYTPKPGESTHSRFDHIGPGYFSTMGIPILLGREIGPQDAAVGLRAAVINETFARQFFPNTSPLGKHIRDTYSGNPAECIVVGVAADAKYNSLRERTPPRLYAPLFNPMWEQSTAVYEVRTFADPASMSSTLRSAVQEVAPSLPPVSIRSMDGLVSDTLQTDRFIEQLSSAFGLLAILLASVGLYGVMAYTVARRTRDIGIRMALGAAPANVRWQILRESLVLATIGIIIGVPVALAGTQLVHSMIFGLGLADPIVIVVAAGLLATVAALAGFLPAHRASRVDPMVALRYE
ncbi:MAG TPA: ABC transporter permease [Candidatus Acidoferrum sp.]|nr:ABC transporter permease [Candidatus Acidoferrum sp.]